MFRELAEGQDGRFDWGRSSSAVADTKEPFAWEISSDNKTIVGADMDGYFRITLVSADRMEKCYNHNGTSPSRSINPPSVSKIGLGLSTPLPRAVARWWSLIHQNLSTLDQCHNPHVILAKAVQACAFHAVLSHAFIVIQAPDQSYFAKQAFHAR